ncbi:MAG TPA: 2,3,4,5-tetrahydropyridine-2,6-dicarboxylate N-succinyltransferase, partial [Candidatus Angelobacter sp.]|nr:2,3,4,5-tetrahydropyridine-2,6-dicarboxylate N-succinyltransferase [Candidatus Angelobacter sp.]
MDILRAEIEHLYARGTLPTEVAVHARHAFREFLEALTLGQVRAAEKQEGQWRVNAWVKQGILLGFRLGELEEMSSGALSFVDKDTFPA